jgi:hypothetical protein
VKLFRYNHPMKTNAKKPNKPTAVRTRSATRERKVQAHVPVWEEILKIAQGIPKSDLHKLPTDLAANHDYYLYGSHLS